MKGLQWLHENFANRVIKFARKGFSNMSSEFHNGRRRRRHRHRRRRRRRLCCLIKIASYVYYTIAGPVSDLQDCQDNRAARVQ